MDAQRSSAFPLLYLRSFVKPMREVKSGAYQEQLHGYEDGSIFMIAEGLNILFVSTLALILIFIAARAAKRKYGISLTSLITGMRIRTSAATDRMFEKQRISATKKCRNCSEQLPLSALICDDCGYNFLSGMVGHGNKMLPAPEPPAQEGPKQNFASARV